METLSFDKMKEDSGHNIHKDSEGNVETRDAEEIDIEEDETEHINRNVTHGSNKIEGKMGHGMEDYLVSESREVNGHSLGLYAIFDGHSGRDVAKYLQRHLFENILSQSDFWTHPKTAMIRAFKRTDADILENVVGSRRGSTAVTAILIDVNGIAEGITTDHEPLKEKKQVERRGGFVIKKPGNVPRVDGQLAMTRAFGDEKLKKHVTAKPDVTTKMMDEDVDFLILASDGLWKVMSNQDACDCIENIADAQEASKELIKEALLWECPDDISCVVIMFNG